MADFTNRANRQVCDVDIRDYATKAPFLFFKKANTTTAAVSGDAVYAMAKGAKQISFPNPIEGTMTLEAQVYPFLLFSLFSDGTVSGVTTIADKKTVKCTTAGQLTVAADKGTIKAGTVCVFASGDFGGEAIEGTFTNGTFTATTSSEIVADSEYEVGFVVETAAGDGVSVVKFANDRMPKDYFITMSTVDKDEKGALTPFKLVAYKATPQRNWDLSFNSEGDPATVTVTFDLLEDEDGNFFDLVEIPDED